MDTIRLEEVKFHPLSFGDNNIRLFRWQGQIYRGINLKKAPYFRDLIDKGLLENVSNKGLFIDTKLTPFTLDGYEMVVTHRTINFPSYPYEWCPVMLKDAALNIIDLAMALAKNGFTLGDAHPWNVLFDLDNYKPVFVDLGSITLIYNSTWNLYGEFCQFCIYPLMLMASGQERIARLLLWENQGVLKSDALHLIKGAPLKSSPNSSILNFIEVVLRKRLPESFQKKIRNTFNSLSAIFYRPLRTDDLESKHSSFERMVHKSHLSYLEKVKGEVLSIDLSIYENQRSSQEPTSDTITAKEQNLQKILSDLQPSSVLDISCNSGRYAKLAASLGSNVIYWNTDSRDVTQVYREARQQQLKILPLVMDFTKPTPAHGLANHSAIAANDRLQCDLVLALDVIHHLVYDRRLNFDQIAEGLGLFSKRWAIVEFLPPEEPEVYSLRSPRVDWYNLDNLNNALKKRFNKVDIMPSFPEHRLLLLCEK